MPGPLPHLYCDIDGILAFQPEGTILAVNGRFGTSYLVAEAVTYPWVSTLPPAQQQWVTANQAVIAANLAPDTRAIGVLRKARKAGYRVTVCTERGAGLEAVTKAWLAYWQPARRGVAFPGLARREETPRPVTPRHPAFPPTFTDREASAWASPLTAHS